MVVIQTRSPGGATEAKQDAIITALDSVGLDAATLAALEQVTATISNFPSDYPDAAAAILLTAIRDAVQGTLDVNVVSSLTTAVSGTVGLDAPTLAALETINAVVSGEVELGTATLAALESVTATVSNFPSDYPDSAAAALLADIRTAVQGTVSVSGTVALDGPTLAALETINTIVQNWPSEFPLPAAQVAALTPQQDGLTDVELRAAAVDVADSGEREYTHVVATVTSAGDTVIHTPAAGKAIRLHWIYAISDPAATTPPLIKVKIGALELYRVYALSKRQRKTGAIDDTLVINLSTTGSVAVTAILEEV